MGASPCGVPGAKDRARGETGRIRHGPTSESGCSVSPGSNRMRAPVRVCAITRERSRMP